MCVAAMSADRAWPRSNRPEIVCHACTTDVRSRSDKQTHREGGFSAAAARLLLTPKVL